MTRSRTKAKVEEQQKKSIPERILDEIADWKVPHDYFWSFYFESVSLSPFWAGEVLYLHGPIWGLVRDYTRPLAYTNSMTFEQVKITWLMLLAQGCRRLYESLSLSKEDIFSVENDSASQMWGGHWLLGLGFYAATSVAIWIEGIPAVADHTLSYQDLIFKAPSLRIVFGVLIFLLASGFQHDCHAYLAYLKASKASPENPAERSPASSPGKKDAAVAKTAAAGTGEGEYKLPTHPAFQPLVCPHYAAECLIYLSMAITAAPQGSWMNWTLVCAFVFATVNLGVTAEGTRAWYEKRFGAEAVEGKWRMVPGVW